MTSTEAAGLTQAIWNVLAHHRYRTCEIEVNTGRHYAYSLYEEGQLSDSYHRPQTSEPAVFVWLLGMPETHTLAEEVQIIIARYGGVSLLIR